MKFAHVIFVADQLEVVQDLKRFHDTMIDLFGPRGTVPLTTEQKKIASDFEAMLFRLTDDVAITVLRNLEAARKREEDNSSGKQESVASNEKP